MHLIIKSPPARACGAKKRKRYKSGPVHGPVRKPKVPTDFEFGHALSRLIALTRGINADADMPVKLHCIDVFGGLEVHVCKGERWMGR